jgi:hypothetical protein
MADDFLSRWSRRKAGKQDDALEPAKEVTPSPIVIDSEAKAADVDAPSPVTLEDVEKIDRLAPDFSAFMKPDVDPAVKQAALKKMFTDPHFNVMDGLDIYIGDYSKPDPLPPGMLERMVQSDMLKLFQKTDDEDDKKRGSDGAISLAAETDKPALEPLAQSDLTSTQPLVQENSASLEELPIESDQKKT